MHPFTQVLSSNEEVLLKHGVQPSSFADYQCLMGDAVDNIPGAPGIGSKTAAKLMSHFGSLERMLSMLHIGHGRALALPDAVVEELVTEVVETAEEEVTVFGEEAVVQVSRAFQCYCELMGVQWLLRMLRSLVCAACLRFASPSTVFLLADRCPSRRKASRRSARRNPRSLSQSSALR